MKSSKWFDHFEIIKVFWTWHLTILVALRFLAPVMCVLELSWEGSWEGPGALEHRWVRDGSPSWSSPEGLHGWCSPKTNWCWETLNAACDEWGNTPCPSGVWLCWSDSFFWGMVWGRWRDKRGALLPGVLVPPRPSWEIKILGFEEGGISLEGIFGFFEITDYCRLSPL